MQTTPNTRTSMPRRLTLAVVALMVLPAMAVAATVDKANPTPPGSIYKFPRARACDANANCNLIAPCPRGWFASGGGYRLLTAGKGVWTVNANEPANNGPGWMINVTNRTDDVLTAEVTAICVALQ